MHRSGTSAITRVLSLLGATLPNQPMLSPKNEDHWEPERLVRLHEAMLEEAGSRWDDWRPFDPSVLGARLDHYRSAIRAVLSEEYGDARLIVIKDPRICRFMPLYIDALTQLGIEPRFVLVQRNPLAVMASLRKRDEMTPRFAALTWLRHVLDATDATRERRRCFLSYESFLDDWQGAVDRIAGELAIEWPRGIESARADIAPYLSRDLQHHAFSLADLKADAETSDWVKEAYAALVRLERGESAEAIATLDRIAREFDAQGELFGEATFPEIAARERMLGEQIAKAVYDGTPRGIAWRLWIGIKQIVKDVYEFFRPPREE
jgi:hypothetical protein